MNWNNLREKVKNDLKIRDIASHYGLSVEKKGSREWCVCPFHDDHKPSMLLKDKNYVCFSCGAKGDVITFVENYENCTFLEALKVLGGLCGVNTSGMGEVIDPVVKTSYEINQESMNYFHYLMNTRNSLDIINYIKSRGLSDASIEKFKLGYVPYGDHIIDFLTAKSFAVVEMYRNGFIKEKDSVMTAVFKNRLMIPIFDLKGNVIGFNSRALKNDVIPKYLLSKSTPTFQKSEVLYNLNNADLKARNIGEMYLVEGVFDAIALDSIGIENVVAVFGTNVSHGLITKLTRYERIVLCLDSDKAGRKATIEFAQILISCGIEVEIVNNFTGRDPDELILKHNEGIAFFENRVDLMMYRIIDLSMSYDLNLIINQKKFYEKAKELCKGERFAMKLVNQLLEGK